MPNKKNYPKNFSPYLPPRLPLEPSKTIVEPKRVASLSCSGDTIDLPSGTYSVEIEHPEGSEEVVLYEMKTVPNQNFNEQYKEYLKGKEKAKEKLKKWKSLKKKWDEEEKAENENHEKLQYEKLKKKFEKLN